MKNIISKFLLLSCLALMFISCAIEGEEFTGVWFTDGELGKMTIDVKPSKGTFVGYLLEYEQNGKLVEGGKDKRHLIFNGIRYKKNKYHGGSFLQSPTSINPCELNLSYKTENKKSMVVVYNCDGNSRTEYWSRDKYPDLPVITSCLSRVNLDDL